MSSIYHRNLFFCLFFATGKTIDTEERVLVTSRSPRYYVSAAYWDRDTFLWAFPAILEADEELAEEMLNYFFTRQAKNIGIHSRYIDGTVLEPGFELDELAAPWIALQAWKEKTGKEIPEAWNVKKAWNQTKKLLREKKHPHFHLYETFLQPTDDMRVYPYLTYDNLLLAKMLEGMADIISEPEWKEEADLIRQAVREHNVVDNRYLAWSVDLEGHHDVYDEPPGTLLLLPYYGQMEEMDPVWQKTVSMIRDKSYPYSFAGEPFGEIGCPHAPHPWMLSVANSLLAGIETDHALDILARAPMDNGIVCESINEKTGESATGEAFATCAGFVVHALRTAWEKQSGQS